MSVLLSPPRRRLFGFLLLAALSAGAAADGADDSTWPRFRGHNGEGKSSLSGAPAEWTLEDYAWTVDLPGKGHSSPVIWEDRLFLTCGHEEGKRSLVCLNSYTGEELWSHTIALDANHLHLKNSYASGTPAVDGERVYAAFADENHYVVTAYTLDGDKVWTRDLGSYASQHGQGVSPIVHGDLVIVPNDQRGPSSIVALNRATGEQVWSTPRAFREASYSTPLILGADTDAPVLVCISGATGIAGIDLKSGKPLWASGELPMRTVASAVHGNGMLIASCGSGGVGKFMAVVNVAEDGRTGGEVRYERKRELPYVPTPIVHGEHLFMWLDGGVVVCIDLASGADVKKERIGGKFSGSPILVDGKLYCLSEAGEVVVVSATPELQILGRNPLGDESYSTPAVANGRMYFRGFSKLACLKVSGP